MQRDLFDNAPDLIGERQVDIETIIEETKMHKFANQFDLTPEQCKIRSLVQWSAEGQELAVAYKDAKDQLAFIRAAVLEPLDILATIATEDYAETLLESKGRFCFRCACGKAVGTSIYSEDFATVIETRCKCGRSSDEYIGADNRRQPMPTEERARRHNASKGDE